MCMESELDSGVPRSPCFGPELGVPQKLSALHPSRQSNRNPWLVGYIWDMLCQNWSGRSSEWPYMLPAKTRLFSWQLSRLSVIWCSWKIPTVDLWTSTTSNTTRRSASRRRSLTCVKCVVVTSCRPARTPSCRPLLSHWTRVTSCSEFTPRRPLRLRKLCCFSLAYFLVYSGWLHFLG